MPAKTLKTLAIVTLVLVVLAMLVARCSGPARSAEETPDTLLPGLADKLNDVTSVKLTQADATLTVTRTGDGWRLDEKASFPAEFETVKALLVGLAELAPREPKTSDPDRYARIGLEDPSPDTSSLGITLLGDGGTPIAEVVLGDQVEASSAPLRYARTAREPQSWLVEGRLEAPTDPMQWIDTTIAQIARDRISRVTITHPTGQVVRLALPEGATDFMLESELPPGRVAKPAGQLSAPAGALAFLRLEDVRAVSDIPEDADDPIVTVFETTDGLRITVTTRQAQGSTWATLDVEAIAQTTQAGDQPGEQDEPASAESASVTEAAELQARVAPWVYAIPSFQADSFRKTLEDLTDPAPDLAPDAEGDPAPTGVPTLDAIDG